MLFHGFYEVATFLPQSQETWRRAGGGAPGFISNLRNSCSRGWQRPILRGKWGEPGKVSRVIPSWWGRPPALPEVPTTGTLLAQWLKWGTTSLPLCAEASEEVMNRAVTAPQLQAPQPDISAGPSPELRPPCCPPGVSSPTLTRRALWIGSGPSRLL